MSATADFLTRARGLFENFPDHSPYGKCPVPGCYCAVTALDRGWSSNSDDDTEEEAYKALAAGGGFTLGTDWRATIICWNAAHTTAEVLAAFDAAIEAS